MGNKEQKETLCQMAGLIVAMGGIGILSLGVVIGLILGDNLFVIASVVGGLITVALGLILSELESQTGLFIAYVDDFVKPKQKTKKKKKTKKEE